MDEKYFLAIDIGATSGRSVVGCVNGCNKFSYEELTRFENPIVTIHGKKYWNIYFLFSEVKKALKECSKKNIKIQSIGIDTWGVDFIYLAKDGTELCLPRSYRDPYTNDISSEVDQLIGKEELYELTGVQTLNFNSIYQLYAAKKEMFTPLEFAKKILFIPDALNYFLTGVKRCEYTIASTSQLLNIKTKSQNNNILNKLGLQENLLEQLVEPGSVVGLLTNEIAQEIGMQPIPVIAVASHDTASAVVAVPAVNQNFAYISSGTWSLLGVELEQAVLTQEALSKNFTNEGGIDGTIRFLKNISGFWIFEQYLDQLKNDGIIYSYEEVLELAENATAFHFFFDPDHQLFSSPSDMKSALSSFAVKSGQIMPEDHGAIFRSIFESLSLKYRYVFDKLKTLVPLSIETLHIVGGGSKNRLLNQFTANALNIKVVTGPDEATAIGNIMLQARALGLIADRWEARRFIIEHIDIEEYFPQYLDEWEEAYTAYVKIINQNII